MEDVLQMVVYEFHIDVRETWLKAIESNRREYRRRQILALIREFPDLTYDALIDDGYSLNVRPDRTKRSEWPDSLVRY